MLVDSHCHLDRLDLAHTFHGPRYPVLAVHLWIAGLVCWTAWAAGRRGVRMRWVVIAFVPWLLAAVVGEVRMARAEAWGALSELETMAGDSWPVAGEVVYVMPPELMPFYQESLGSFEVRRIERLPCDAADAGSVSVLDVNLWHGLDRPRDHLMRAMLRGGRLGREVERFAFPPEQPALVLYRVAKLDGELLGALCRRGLQPPLRSEMTGSVSEALPEDQRSQSEWSYLEVSPDLELYRWSTAARALVRFDRDVGPGEYVLHLVGYRTDAPRPDAPVAVELPEVGLQWQKVVPAGRFHLCLPISWPGGGDPPALNVEYPVWSTGDIEAGGRTLGFLFYGAWLTPVSGEVVGREGDPCASPRSPDS